jgi:hypothetical protein
VALVLHFGGQISSATDVQKKGTAICRPITDLLIPESNASDLTLKFVLLHAEETARCNTILIALDDTPIQPAKFVVYIGICE